MEPDTLPALLTFDYKLIDEAIRRLVEGTCCLVGEEQLAVNDLFQKLKGALIDHIQFEEESVFPSLKEEAEIASVPDFVGKMRREHSEIKELLAEAKKTIDASLGVAFRAVLRQFLMALQRHRSLEQSVPYARIAGALGDENIKRMIVRSHDGFLK